MSAPQTPTPAESQRARLSGLEYLIITVMMMTGSGVAWYVTQDKDAEKAQVETYERLLREERAAHDRSREQFEERRATLTRENAQLYAQQAQYLEEITRLRLASISENETPLQVVEKIISSDPGISWYKIRTGPGELYMGGVSRGYARELLGRPPSFYSGKTDYEIWPDEIAEKHVANDEAVYRAGGEGLFFEEWVEGGPLGIAGHFRGRKFYVRLDTGEDLILGSGTFIPAAVE